MRTFNKQTSITKRQAVTVGDLLRVIAEDESYNQKIALVQGKRRLTWSELNSEANSIANSLLEMGFRKNQIIGIYSENSPEYVAALFGMQKVGLVPMPLNIRLRLPEVSSLLERSKAVGILASSRYMPYAEKLAESGKTLKRPILLDVGTKPEDEYQARISYIPDSPEPSADVDDGDPAIVIFTGGTTGQPKGVVLTHHSILKWCEMLASHTLQLISEGKVAESALIPPEGRELKYLIPTPFYHVSGYTTLVNMVFSRGTVVLTSSPSFSPEEVCELIHKESVTGLFMVPTMYKMLLEYERLSDYSFSSLLVMASGGAKMSASLKRELLKKFPHITLIDGFGQTETFASTIISFLTSKDSEGIADGLVGRPVSGVEVKIVNESGEEVKPGEVGEVIYRSDALMKEYLNDPESTRSAFRDGWFRSGDLCKMDESGNIYYVGRKGEVIVTGAEKVNPEEVEEVLLMHPDVEQAVVIGVPDERLGEAVRAVVKLRSGSNTTAQQLIAHCKEHLAGYKCPKTVVIAPYLPLTTDGKVLRATVKAIYGKDL
jgi:fatty-acyl-CoA synthase